MKKMNLQGFEYYLKSENFRESTIAEHIRNIERFEKWANENKLTGVEMITYSELLGYVQDLQKKALNVATINIRLCSLRKYYDHLKHEGMTEKNPAKRLFIKGAIKKVTTDALSYADLESLYNDYAHYCDTRKLREQKHSKVALKRKVIAGMMIFQGLHGGELLRLEVCHINTAKGLIFVPGAARAKERELQLSPVQIIALYHYLNGLPAQQEKLFDCTLHNQVHQIICELKGINPRVQNCQHIRSSVILHWLRMYGKRQVQYMMGHKYIGSTEHYQQQELETLTGALEKHHPFG